MNLESLKEPLGERFAELEQYVADLVGQRDVARKESVEGRKSLKAKAEQAEALSIKLMEKLGIESVEEVDALPPAKGQAEALKQLETRLKKADADIKAREQAWTELNGKYQKTITDAQLRAALAAHEWIDQDLVESYLRGRLAWDDDQPWYRNDQGATVALQEGVAHLAQSKPHLLKSPVARGSGYNPTARGGEVVRNPWAKDTFNFTEQLRLADDNPTLAAHLKAAAGIS